MAVLAEFSHLEELRLPDATALRYAVLGSWCGTPSVRGEEAVWQYRLEHKSYIEALDRVTSLVMEMLPRLQRLTIADSEPTITHDEEGKASASWPWSGRSDEYLDEKFGKPKA